MDEGGLELLGLNLNENIHNSVLNMIQYTSKSLNLMTLFSSVPFTARLCIQREIQRGKKDKVIIMQQHSILVFTTQE